MENRTDPFEGEISLAELQNIKDAPSVEEKPSKKGEATTQAKKNITMTGEPADQIVINPQTKPPMNEELDNDTHAIIVGGFSPFTKAHQALVQHAKAKYKHVHVFTTQSKTRPIPADDKVKYIQKAVGNDVHVSTTQTPLHAASEVFKRGAKKAAFIGGSDRKSIVDRLNQYNGKEGGHGHYNFNEPIKLDVFGGERDEKSTGLAGISGTKARAAKNPEELKHFLPTELHGDAERIHKQIHEHLELIAERVVSFKQRLRRRITMKKYKNKIARARSIRRKRFAQPKALRRRAFMRAKNIIRTRIAGRRGANYKKLSTAQKIAVDRMVDKRSALVKKIATRIAPRVRRDEVRRLAAVSQHKKYTATKLPIMSGYEPNEKELKALMEKSEATGIPLSILKQVFNRGMAAANANYKPTKTTAQQQAFARINSFIKQGKSYKEDDKDLTAEATMIVARNVEKNKDGKMVNAKDPLVTKLRKLQGSIERKILDEIAGEEGTSQLAKKYAKETPGQKKVVQS